MTAVYAADDTAAALADVPARREYSILPLEVRDLAFAIGGTRLIDNLSLRLEAGPRTIIMGPNGAGKSLLLRLMHGLIEPTGGSISWAGKTPGQARRAQAMVFQRPVLLRRSARANLSYALKMQDTPRGERKSRVAQALERTGLVGLADRQARVLSFGEQQRLALARAWSLDPQVLLLDEPTANLDPAATRRIEETIEAIAEGGAKIVMTTHDLGQAKRLADEVVFIHRGRIVERAVASRFFSRPGTAEGRAFLAGDLLW
jgi:tungstate transport system ATP-binding protein